MASCEPDPIIPEPTPKVWEKFIGTYNVTKMDNGETYYMSITHLGMDTLDNGAIIDSLLIMNYGDLFEEVIYFSSNGGYSDNRIIKFPTNWPTIDKFGYRWAFWVNSQDTLTPELENTLVNDTLLLYFTLNNIAFYFEDGVPYYECQCKHLAVKVQ
jgi:hypothetical protein